MQTFGTRPTSIHTLGSPFVLPPPLPESPTFFSPPILSPVLSRSSSSSSGFSNASRNLRRHLLIRDLGIDNLLVPKNRRAKFDLELQLHDLNNVPLVSGHAYIKWHIEGNTRADCRGRTKREPIKDHKVLWNYTAKIPTLRITIGKGNMLSDLNLIMEVHQEYGDRERILLGIVRVNLAEYAGLEKETRRYLMQDSKINSTVKVGIEMHQIGGDTNYQAPQLKGAQVFAGIAGIINEQRETDDSRNMHLQYTKSRETGATQDMYRRTLAASWQLIPGELNADECIEDIFAGGDGWSGSSGGRRGKPKSVRLSEASDSDSLSQLSVTASTPTTSTHGDKPQLLSVTTIEPASLNGKKKGYALSVMTARSRTSSGKTNKSQGEIDEFEARDDLVSWRMPSHRLRTGA
ncbi:N-terminal C2 in EEIG1 and EHBP1 proteins-domain-containing protein [Pyronema omphalodes]|nr:N-terminal C2 in EEIG1 and EHBP1 proteins-domain-containing protein [Pyronema omphalodes]